MRVSTDPNDSGFGTWQAMQDNPVKVFLDGVEQSDAVMAGDQLGIVQRCKRNAQGEIYAEGDVIVTEQVRGVVTFALETPPSIRYRKKPVVIDAIQFTSDGPDNHADIMDFMGCTKDVFDNSTTPRSLIIHTLEGDMRASVGDWIIKGVKGEFYPCKADIFAATYEEYTPMVREPYTNRLVPAST